MKGVFSVKVRLYALVRHNEIIVSGFDSMKFLKKVADWCDDPIEEFLNGKIGKGEYEGYRVTTVTVDKLSDSDQYELSEGLKKLVEEFSVAE